jgi:hypothetical protein
LVYDLTSLRLANTYKGIETNTKTKRQIEKKRKIEKERERNK